MLIFGEQLKNPKIRKPVKPRIIQALTETPEIKNLQNNKTPKFTPKVFEI